MDPNATLLKLRTAILSGDKDEAIEAAADLDEWLTNGGFLPTLWGRKTKDYGVFTLEELASPENKAKRAARAADTREGQLADGRSWKDIAPWDPDLPRYPKNDSHTWGAFAGMAVELGGYSDMTLVDPYSGREFWLEKAFTSADEAQPLSFWDALRRTIDAAEATEFGKREDAELD